MRQQHNVPGTSKPDIPMGQVEDESLRLRSEDISRRREQRPHAANDRADSLP
jgi:hypothetical protein